MKRLVSVPKKVERVVEVVTEQEDRIVSDEETAFDKLLGKEVALFCSNYIYSGRLTGINGSSVELSSPSIVFETGAFSSKNWKDAQRLPCAVAFVERSAIECSFEVKR